MFKNLWYYIAQRFQAYKIKSAAKKRKALQKKTVQELMALEQRLIDSRGEHRRQLLRGFFNHVPEGFKIKFWLQGFDFSYPGKRTYDAVLKQTQRLDAPYGHFEPEFEYALFILTLLRVRIETFATPLTHEEACGLGQIIQRSDDRDPLILLVAPIILEGVRTRGYTLPQGVTHIERPKVSKLSHTDELSPITLITATMCTGWSMVGKAKVYTFGVFNKGQIAQARGRVRAPNPF